MYIHGQSTDSCLMLTGPLVVELTFLVSPKVGETFFEEHLIIIGCLPWGKRQHSV